MVTYNQLLKLLFDIRGLSMNIHVYANSIATHETPLILVSIMRSIMWLSLIRLRSSELR